MLDAIFKTTIGPALTHISGDAEQTLAPCIKGNQTDVIINNHITDWLHNCLNKHKCEGMVTGEITHVSSQQYPPHYLKESVIKTANQLNRFLLISTSRDNKRRSHKVKILAPSTIPSFKANQA